MCRRYRSCQLLVQIGPLIYSPIILCLSISRVNSFAAAIALLVRVLLTEKGDLKSQAHRGPCHIVTLIQREKIRACSQKYVKHSI